MKDRSFVHYAALLACLLWSTLSFASDSATETTVAARGEQAEQNLDHQIQDLKKEVLKLNRELFILEEELLFPSSTQVTVFVSLDVGKFFTLDSVQLKIDDKVVTNYLYTEQETNALRRGGIQRLYNGNLKTGTHELVAFFVGVGPMGRDYRRAATLTFDKALSPKFIELKIADDIVTQQPEFSITEW
ncbi:MAG TPA: AraC family transcriptional regulator [Candidatus Tenderia sp.]|nr:AraC family transcriptional regulator [Candidatus Tenderia sp.]